MSEQKFIIMEQQVNLREVLVFYVESTFGFTPLRATNSKEAIQYLTNSDVVLVLCGTGDHADEASLLTNYCSQFLSKNPILFHPLNNLLAPKSVKKEDVDKSEITEDKTNIQVLIEKLNGFFKINPDGPKKEFTSISIDSLPFFNGITSDLFIKLQSDRYIKLFKDGDVVNNSDVAKYKNKGVLQLYLKKECCFWTLKQIEN